MHYNRVFWHQRSDKLEFEDWKIQLSDEYWEHYGEYLMDAISASGRSNGMQWHKRLVNIWRKEYDFRQAAMIVHESVMKDLAYEKSRQAKPFPAGRMETKGRNSQGPKAGH